MTLATLAIFAAALFLAAGSPGPSVAALVARTLIHGWRDVLPFLAAMWVGEAVWLTFAVFGLAALAAAFHWAFLVLKYAGVAYLLYLAWKMWHAPLRSAGEGAPPRGSPLRMFMAGLSVTLGNPKIMVFYLALLPTIIDLRAVTALGWAELVATMLIALAVVDLGYVLLAHTARGFLASPRAMRLTSRVSAAIFGGAAVAIAAR